VDSPGGTVTAEAELFDAIIEGRVYFNTHTGLSPGSEVRGFLTGAPEPAAFALTASALAGLAALRRRS
jgi:hypothetical protein